MIENLNIEDILFLDIETVPAYAEFDALPENMQALWTKKAGHIDKNSEKTPSELYNRAGIYAEFGKIVCISCGFLRSNSIRMKSFYGDHEEDILKNFASLLTRSYSSDKYKLCAHNGKEFDFPYISRRMLINGIQLPVILRTAGKKPWEVQHLDTMELWKFGDYKHYTSLELLAAVFGIPTPKDDIDGSQVAEVYWKDKDLKRIAKYCEKDVLTTAQLMRRYMGLPLIRPEAVYSI